MKTYKTTSEKLDDIAKELFGKSYQDLMEKGRITNGVQGYKSSVKSNTVFKEYLKRNALEIK